MSSAALPRQRIHAPFVFFLFVAHDADGYR
jgi:hypothetical protein